MSSKKLLPRISPNYMVAYGLDLGDVQANCVETGAADPTS